MTLTDLRRAVALTQDDLAKACGVTKTTVSAWERGAAVPRLRHIRVLADALKSTIQEVQSVIDGQQAKKKTSADATSARNASAGTSIGTPATTA